MVGKIIRDYMAGGAKRLTVPGFGTFMRKSGEGNSLDGKTSASEVIFVDLLRKDDGVLRELVEDYGHYSEVEAMALVDRFVFETKNAIERQGSAAIEDFGTMTLDHKGSYHFDHSPKTKPKTENAVQEKLFADHDRRPAVATIAPKAPTSPKSPPAPTSAERAQKEIERTPRPLPTVQNVRNVRTESKPRSDVFMIVAIAVAVIAIIALVFGLSTGNMPFMNR